MGSGKGLPAVFEMDADLSHPADRIPAMIEMARKHPVVLGSRYVGRRVNVVNWPLSAPDHQRFRKHLCSYGDPTPGHGCDGRVQLLATGGSGSRRPGPGGEQRVRLPDRAQAQGLEKGLSTRGDSHRFHGTGDGRVENVEKDRPGSCLEGLEVKVHGPVRPPVGDPICPSSIFSIGAPVAGTTKWKEARTRQGVPNAA